MMEQVFFLDFVFWSIVCEPQSVKPKIGTTAVRQVMKATWFLVEPLGENLDEVLTLIEAGRVKPLLDSVWQFEE